MVADWFKELWEDIKESAGEKSWPVRLVLWCWFVWIAFNHLRDPEYGSFLSGLNLGIHEFGHLICMPLGQVITVFGGSFVQCLVPVISIFMFWKQRDYFAWSFSFVWLGTNLLGVARYIGDSRALQLDLVTPFGGGDSDNEVGHDWNWLLHRYDLLSQDTTIATWVRGFGFVSLVMGVIWGGWMLWMMIRAPKPEIGSDWKMPDNLK